MEEKKRLTERLQESVDDPITGTGQLRRQVESLKEEIFKLETCEYIAHLLKFKKGIGYSLISSELNIDIV